MIHLTQHIHLAQWLKTPKINKRAGTSILWHTEYCGLILTVGGLKGDARIEIGPTAARRCAAVSAPPKCNFTEIWWY